MRRKQLLTLAVLGAILISIIAVLTIPSLAATTTDAVYKGTILVTSTNTSVATAVSTNTSIPSQYWVSNGYVSSNWSNVAIVSNNGTDIPFMPPTSTMWMMFHEAVPALTNLPYTLYVGGATSMNGKIRYFPVPGYGGYGMFTTDNATSLTLGNTFSIEQKGWIDTAAVGGEFVVKSNGGGGYEIRVYIPVSGNITAMTTGGWTMSVAGIPSGEHTITVSSNATTARLFIDDGSLFSTTATAVSIAHNAYNWAFVNGGSMIYMEYQKITIGTTLVQHIIWNDYNLSGYFTNLVAGTGNNATFVAAIVGNNASVSATLTDFQPITQTRLTTLPAFATGSLVTGNITMPSQMYTELSITKIPGGDFVDALLAAGDLTGGAKAIWWYPFIFIGIGLLSLLLYGPTKSALIQCIIIECLLALFGVLGLIPFWPVWLFLIPALAIIISQKHYGWG